MQISIKSQHEHGALTFLHLLHSHPRQEPVEEHLIHDLVRLLHLFDAGHLPLSRLEREDYGSTATKSRSQNNNFPDVVTYFVFLHSFVP